MTAEIHRLPDLARVRAIEERIRASSDEDVADLLCTDDGQWLFTEAMRFASNDVSVRVVQIITAGLPEGTIWSLLGVEPSTSGGKE